MKRADFKANSCHIHIELSLGRKEVPTEWLDQVVFKTSEMGGRRRSGCGGSDGGGELRWGEDRVGAGGEHWGCGGREGIGGETGGSGRGLHIACQILKPLPGTAYQRLASAIDSVTTKCETRAHFLNEQIIYHKIFCMAKWERSVEREDGVLLHFSNEISLSRFGVLQMLLARGLILSRGLDAFLRTLILHSERMYLLHIE